MSYFENEEEVQVTRELLDNFASDKTEVYDIEDNNKSIEQIREERYIRQEERRLRKKQERRSSFVNNFMPVMALLLLVCTVSYMNSLQFGLVISYNDEQVGIVQNADVVDEATNLIDSKIINKSLDTLEDEPKYKVAVVNNTSDFQTSTELSRSIIANDNVLADEICGVFADGTFVGAVENEEDAQRVLNEILSEKKKSIKDLGKVDSVEFNSNVVLEVGLYAKSSVVDAAEIKNRLENNVDLSYKIIVLQEQNVKIKYKTEYVVDASKSNNYEKVTTKGQLGEGIATNRAVYIDGNQISAEHIKVTATKKPVNQVITVSPDNENAAKAKSSESDTESKNKAKDSDVDTDKAADKTKDSNTDTEKASNGKSDKTTNDSSDTQKESKTESSKESDAKPQESAQTENAEEKKTSEFVWPAPNCGSITNDFGYQGEKLHKGVDISGPGAEGQPVVASAGGYVTTAVIDYGSENYGCYLIIDHGNGYQTLYAQCSDIYVTPGTYVEQGQTVAAVGSTGDSTGPHLHFEIIANGEYVNPANYLY